MIFFICEALSCSAALADSAY